MISWCFFLHFFFFTIVIQHPLKSWNRYAPKKKLKSMKIVHRYLFYLRFKQKKKFTLKFKIQNIRSANWSARCHHWKHCFIWMPESNHSKVVLPTEFDFEFPTAEELPFKVQCIKQQALVCVADMYRGLFICFFLIPFSHEDFRCNLQEKRAASS